MYKIDISKKGGIWFAVLCKKVETTYNENPLLTVYHWASVDAVESDNYLQLNKEIGNKNWIELLSKNE